MLGKVGHLSSYHLWALKPRGRLNIVESTNFRELIHLDLRLRQGSDEVVKKHLAKKLRLCRTELQGLERRLSQSNEALQHSSKQVDELTARRGLRD